MYENKFDNFYSKKTISELIEKVLRHKTTGTSLDKEWYDALILHFSKRDLTDEQKRTIDHILTTESEILKNENILQQINQWNNNPSESTTINDKYPALRTLSFIYKISAWVIGLCCVILAIIFVGENELLTSLECLVVGALSTITVIAFSELIILFIDIENNTRQNK